MKYFRLNDDISVPGRWHIGDAGSDSGTTLDFLDAKPLPNDVELSAPISHPGKPLDFCITSFGVPVARQELAEVIASIAAADVQVVPIGIGDFERDQFAVPHCLRTIECLNEAKSDFIKWDSGDSRPDLTGQYRMVTKLVVDPRKIPTSAHFFRIERWPISLVVSDVVKKAMERKGCLGAKFEAIEIDGN